jgi:sugar O-acyltransferase (sialic acid O-acetyltransferase NeuD family)
VKLLVAGAGGHAKVVIDAALAAGIRVVAALGEPGGVTDCLGIPVVHSAEGVIADAFIAAVGDNARRAEVFDSLVAEGWRPAAVVHPSAIVASSAVIGAGTFVAAGVVVNPEARIGQNVVLNTGCTVDHDCVVGDHAHVAPGANLCGGARIGPGALLGVGASVVPGTAIGEWSVIGSGAAVVTPVPDRTVWAGVPARQLRSVKE